MIKRMTMLARRDDLGVVEFGDYWYGRHADIVRGMPGLHRYLQNHIRRDLSPPGARELFRVDGIPELWFADEQAKSMAFASAAAKALPADERNFLKGITIFAVEETVIAPGQGPTKVMILRRGGAIPLPASESRDWCARLRRTMPSACSCIANRVLTSEHRPGVWHESDPPDLIVELRFDGAEDADAAIGSAPVQAILSAEPATMAAAYLVEERAII